jgi:photosystem II stability/assembly factor-like uncharacterized protein
MRAVLCFLCAAAPLLSFTACESELPKTGPTLEERVKTGLRGEGKLFIPEKEARTSASNYFPSR